MRIQTGFRAIGNRIFKGRNSQLPWIHRSGAGGIERRHHTGFQHGLHGFRFFPGQQAHTRYTALDAVLQLPFQLGDGSLIIGHQQRSTPGKGYVQFFAKGRHIGIAPDSQFCF